MQLGLQQREPVFDLLKLPPPDLASPAAAAQHFAPVMLHSTMDLPHGTKVSGHAVVRIVPVQGMAQLR
jgi:hypothetical protein